MRKLVLICWSFTPEPAYGDYLKRHYDEIVLVPLRYFARENMRALFPGTQEVSVGEWVTAQERRRLWDEAIACANRCWDEVAQDLRQPWLCGVYQDVVQQYLYAYAFWSRFVAAVRDRYPDADLKCHGPQSYCAINDGCTACDVQCLDLVLTEESEVSKTRRPFWRAAMHRLAGHVGWLVNRYAGGLADPPGGRSQVEKKGRVLVFGLQPTDCKVQRPLMSILERKAISGLRWLVPDQEWLHLTEDEKRASEVAQGALGHIDHVVFDPAGPYLAMTWKRPWLARLSKLNVTQAFGRLLAHAGAGTIYEGMGHVLARLIMATQPDVRLQYASISSLLDRIDPAFVLANSNVRLTALVRGWVRERNRTFIQFPHGAAFSHDQHSKWDADIFAVPGAHEKDLLTESGREIPDRVWSVGGLHFEKQAAVMPAAVIASPDRPWEAVWLLSVSTLYGMPDVYHEMEDDVRMWARVLRDAGGRLVLRCHRREDINRVYEHITARCVEDGLPVRMSDPMSSLNGDLAASELAIVRTWGGAGLLALYAKTPVIGFMPRAGLPGSDDILSLLPLVARDEASSTDIIRDLRRDISFQNTILEQQETVLEHLCENPRSGHSYERAADLIVELVNG